MTTSPTSNVRGALYARVSSDAQAEEQTIDSQVAKLSARIDHDRCLLVDRHRFLDDGVSGSTLNRPALERLRRSLLGRVPKTVRSLVRSSCSQVRVSSIVDRRVAEARHRDRVPQPRHWSSPEEDLLLLMQGMFAEYERAKIMERSRRGKRHAATRGSVNVLSAAPYG